MISFLQLSRDFFFLHYMNIIVVGSVQIFHCSHSLSHYDNELIE